MEKKNVGKPSNQPRQDTPGVRPDGRCRATPPRTPIPPSPVPRRNMLVKKCSARAAKWQAVTDSHPEVTFPASNRLALFPDRHLFAINLSGAWNTISPPLES